LKTDCSYTKGFATSVRTESKNTLAKPVRILMMTIEVISIVSLTVPHYSGMMLMVLRSLVLEFVNYNFNHDEWHNSAHILKKHLWSQQKVAYRSPLSFGPMPGPRQDQFGRSLIGANSRSHFSTYSITFKTSATLLKTWFPTPSFTFTSPGTVAEVTLECTKLDQLYWLGQKGYNFVALWIHGVQYTRKDGSSIQGSFLPVLFESSADPIITGRDELGMPKLFCDIDITKANSITNITCTWKETTFLDITVEDVLDTDQIQQNSDNTKSTGLNSTALYYRYVPSVGNPHTSDAEYAVAIDQSTNQEEEVKHKGLGSAILRFQKANRESLPTLHHIAEALSEMPIIGTPKATYREGFSRGALSGPERLE
jgi:hypothetical protein